MNTDTSPQEPPDEATETLNRSLEMLSPVGISAPDMIRAVHQELLINNILPGLLTHEPTAMLLDINNLFRRADDRGFRIDYARLKTMLEQRCDLRYSAAFSAVDRNDPGADDWVNYMDKIGYDVIGRDLLQYTDQSTGRRVSKGNMDVQFTIAAMKLPDTITHIILGTCDGDFTPLVKELQSNPSRRVSVLGVAGSNWAGMSRNLAKQADNFYNLSLIQEHIHYQGGRNA